MSKRSKPQTKKKEASKKTRVSDFKIDLDLIPNGDRKPAETCQFLEAMRNWRAKSAQSTVLIR